MYENMMENKILKKNVKMALEIFRNKDFLLLENDVNEITINHKIAEYLGLMFKEMDVDIEYNRVEDEVKYLSGFNEINIKEWLLDSGNKKLFFNLFNQKDIYNLELVEKIENRIRSGLIKSEDNKLKKGIYPDIIIHKRNTDYNLLAIEVKKSNNFSKDQVLYDIIKLVKYKAGLLNYEYCLFIKINIDSKKCYEFFWI